MFAITGMFNVVNMDFGPNKWKKYVRYNREFVIVEFVITEFDITEFVITEFVTTKFHCNLI